MENFFQDPGENRFNYQNEGGGERIIWKDENGYYHADEGEWLCKNCRWRDGKDVYDYQCKHPNRAEPSDYPFVVSCKKYEEKTKDIELYEQAVTKWGVHT